MVSLTQLGVDSNAAVRGGGLAGEPTFLGDSIAETISANTGIGGWNNDDSDSMNSTSSWVKRSVRSSSPVAAGVFSFFPQAGGAADVNSHRTILSGY